MLNKKYILTLIVILSSLQVYSQSKNYETNPDRKRTFNWLFGDSIWLDFKTNPPIVKSGSKISAIESATAYSDTTGKLLLYSDGITVWNGNHKVIKNGTGLNGHSSSSQGSVFVKHPLLDSIVYLFTTDAQGGSNGFQVNTISINSNLDSSFITEKNKILLNQTCESIAVTQHQNDIYTWVTVHSKTGNTFYAYLINQNGIVNCPVTSNEGYMYDGNILSCQTMNSFSDNGKYFSISAFSTQKAQILKFNNLLGTFKLLYQFSALNTPTGIAFSNDNKYLYIVERSKQINQINTSNWQSNTILKNINNNYFINHLNKNPYKEIFINILDSMSLGSILNPDSFGNSSNTVLKYLYLNGNKIKYGFNNFNQSYFYTPSIDFKYQLNCITNTIEFNGLDTFSANNHTWQIGKANKPLEASYNTKIINHTFIDTGSYNIRYIAQNGSRLDTIIKIVILYPKINKSFLGKDTTYYTGDAINKALKTPYGMHCQTWQDSSGLSTYTANKKGIYTCKLTTQAFCEVIDTLEIKECLNLTTPTIYRKFTDSLFCKLNLVDTFIWYKNNMPYKITYSNGTNESNIKLTDTGAYRVEAIKYGHCNKSSTTFYVNKLGIENLLMQSITIYPNPSNGKIKIENKLSKEVNYSLTNTLGQNLQIGTIINGINNLDFNFSKGVYILTITNDNQTIKHKLIIQ